MTDEIAVSIIVRIRAHPALVPLIKASIHHAAREVAIQANAKLLDVHVESEYPKEPNQ